MLNWHNAQEGLEIEKDIERWEIAVIAYINEYIQSHEVTLQTEADSDEAVWCNIFTGTSTLTIGLVLYSPNIRCKAVTYKT